MKNNDSGEAMDRHEEVKELLERCREMERDLADIKDRLTKVQRSVEDQLRQPPGRKASDGSISTRSAHAFAAGSKGKKTGRRVAGRSGRRLPTGQVMPVEAEFCIPSSNLPLPIQERVTG